MIAIPTYEIITKKYIHSDDFEYRGLLYLGGELLDNALKIAFNEKLNSRSKNVYRVPVLDQQSLLLHISVLSYSEKYRGDFTVHYMNNDDHYKETQIKVRNIFDKYKEDPIPDSMAGILAWHIYKQNEDAIVKDFNTYVRRHWVVFLNSATFGKGSIVEGNISNQGTTLRMRAAHYIDSLMLDLYKKYGYILDENIFNDLMQVKFNKSISTKESVYILDDILNLIQVRDCMPSLDGIDTINDHLKWYIHKLYISNIGEAHQTYMRVINEQEKETNIPKHVYTGKGIK